jgi:hypothetical protein
MVSLTPDSQGSVYALLEVDDFALSLDQVIELRKRQKQRIEEERGERIVRV